jgi:hypothetical protein
MIIAQGWKDNKVNVIALSRCQNGMEGWTLYLGVYDHNKGETFETAKWECKASSHCLVTLFYYHVFSEMAAWVGGDKAVKDLQDILLTIHEQIKGVAAYIDAAYKQGKLQMHEPAIYQNSMQQAAS